MLSVLTHGCFIVCPSRNAGRQNWFLYEASAAQFIFRWNWAIMTPSLPLLDRHVCHVFTWHISGTVICFYSMGFKRYLFHAFEWMWMNLTNKVKNGEELLSLCSDVPEYIINRTWWAPAACLRRDHPAYIISGSISATQWPSEKLFRFSAVKQISQSQQCFQRCGEWGTSAMNMNFLWSEWKVPLKAQLSF